MPRLIEDEFTYLPISRQRRYQLRKEKAGRCRLCGKPRTGQTGYCARHLLAQQLANSAKSTKAAAASAALTKPAPPDDDII